MEQLTQMNWTAQADVVLARLARDPNERIIFCQVRNSKPFYIQWPQTRPAISDRVFDKLRRSGYITQCGLPVVQRHGGLKDDAVAWYLNEGELVYTISERGFQHLKETGTRVRPAPVARFEEDEAA